MVKNARTLPDRKVHECFLSYPEQYFKSDFRICFSPAILIID